MITIPKIKELPNNCRECQLSYLDHECEVRCPWFNCRVDNWGGKERRLRDCPLVESEPFINKPCISQGVCREDKIKVLDKLRAELHETAEMHEDGDYYLRDEWIDDFFDKYKAESERDKG